MGRAVVFSILMIGLGVYVSLQLWHGPLEAYSTKAHFFVDLMNGLVVRFGPMGAAAIVMIVAIGLAGAAIFRAVAQRSKQS